MQQNIPTDGSKPTLTANKTERNWITKTIAMMDALDSTHAAGDAVRAFFRQRGLCLGDVPAEPGACQGGTCESVAEKISAEARMDASTEGKTEAAPAASI